MGDVTSHPLANQAEACLFGRSLNTSLCEIYDHNLLLLDLLDLPVLLSHCVAFMTDLNVGQTISNTNSLVLVQF